ncbi:hypothetical protein BpHYR1_028318 [Brachionus plicatilis]|uniref:Uncharacterized protein n=1 Tax=Brachionus plicatilis TaxID=10195 RepID=A0A3M7R446_BRAPC|nr:hypothetical protein BpHYR1_028318 [Brachionus plicatilis]
MNDNANTYAEAPIVFLMFYCVLPSMASVRKERERERERERGERFGFILSALLSTLTKIYYLVEIGTSIIGAGRPQIDAKHGKVKYKIGKAQHAQKRERVHIGEQHFQNGSDSKSQTWKWCPCEFGCALGILIAWKIAWPELSVIEINLVFGLNRMTSASKFKLPSYKSNLPNWKASIWTFGIGLFT